MEKARHTESHSDSNSALASLRNSATRFPFSVMHTVLRTGLMGSCFKTINPAPSILDKTLNRALSPGKMGSRSAIYGVFSSSNRNIRISTALRSLSTDPICDNIRRINNQVRYLILDVYFLYAFAIYEYILLNKCIRIMRSQNVKNAAPESENAARQNQGKNAFLLTQKTPCISSESSGRKPLNRWQKHPAWSLLVCLPSISTPVRTAFNNDSAKAL